METEEERRWDCLAVVVFGLPDSAGGVTFVCDAVEENLAGRDLVESVVDGLAIGILDEHQVRSV